VETLATRPPVPPFTRETAIRKVHIIEDAWNSREPEKMALAYTADSRWRNRTEFVNGRQEIVEFLKRKWVKELEYRLIKGLWAYEATVSGSVSLTNATTIQEIGFVRTATRIGSSMKTD
jgi:uncharacterized protein